MPAHPPSYIKPTSRFSPLLDNTSIDSRGNSVIPYSFPVDWLCGTCGSTHSVLDILTTSTTTQTGVRCGCDKPTLQAIYDQFGRIFLYWRADPSVDDLSDPAKVQEAAWRVWRAGGDPWLPDVLEAQKATPAIMDVTTDAGGGCGSGIVGGATKMRDRRNRLSQSSMSSGSSSLDDGMVMDE
ncbi:hypothetical protein QBC46DRAFT_346477 [Diplogelasinospora grovesii]|uniref:Uncharacterized protein n=1 Tax=Diplogelasinospora grovesii TaxID=303347 RepID=A0AAN6MXY2_9PEZI|nr:hypothetical protein QBC46DRAFT_346477 [Diplogelasinospora grovesii]